MKNISLAALAMAATLALPTFALADSQDHPHAGGGVVVQQQAGGAEGAMQMRGTGGEIKAINQDSILITAFNGQQETVKLTPKTEFRVGREPGKLADLKVGDRIGVRGERQKDGTVLAELVMSGMRTTMDPAAMGKEFLAGEVKAIDGTRLTVLRPDGVSQEFEVDENTTFRNGRELVTLPDFKVGDSIFARGALKDGLFLATSLNKGARIIRQGGPGGAGGPVMMQIGPGGEKPAEKPAEKKEVPKKQ